MESMDEILIHKKKEAKKKQKAKGLLPIAYRTKGEGSTKLHETQQSIAPEVKGQLDNRNSDKSRTRTQILNSQIDTFINELLMEELITDSYLPYYAKACHLLGIATLHRLAINARNGLQPQKLFAYKVKGAMSLHYKQTYYGNSDINNQ